MTVSIGGVATVAVFYGVVLGVGIWAGCKKKQNEAVADNVLLAGRKMGVVVGILSMTATWVGAFNGISEGVVTRGVLWVQGPWGYCISLILGGLIFAGPMRKQGYVTMLDPFQHKYGRKIGGLLFLPAFCGEIIWCSAILAALGSSLTALLELDYTISIVISAFVAVIYTLFGGLRSVAYTDVVELALVAFGLILTIPFAWYHPAVDHDKIAEGTWVGTIETQEIGVYIDQLFLIILGGIPWQAYFQRVLASRSIRFAQVLSYTAGIGSLIFLIPPMLVGIIATGTDWANGTDYGLNITTPEQNQMILPLVFRYLTPEAVSFIGLGAISAAVMSTADSSILSASSMFTHNVYKTIFAPQASDKHLLWAVWFAVVLAGSLATGIAIFVNSIYALSYLASDLVYVIIFPQLLLVIHWEKYCNTYGCIVSYIVGLVLRILSGDPFLNLAPIIEYPFTVDGRQLFPFRTFAMLMALVSHVVVSLTARYIFTSGRVSLKWDFLGCFKEKESFIDSNKADESSSDVVVMENLG